MIRRGASSVSVGDIVFIISEPSEASFTVSKGNLLLHELLLIRNPSILPIMYLFADPVVYLEVQHPCCLVNDSSSSANASAGVEVAGYTPIEFAGQLGAGHLQVGCDVVQRHVHLPVAHMGRQG